MQLLLLRYREDIIAAKVSKEHIEESLKSEILFLKDQVSAFHHFSFSHYLISFTFFSIVKLVMGVGVQCTASTTLNRPS